MDKIISTKDEALKEEDEDDEEEEEEALSLCDFPLNCDEAEKKASSSKCSHHHRRSSSQPPDTFEFFNDLNSGNSNNNDNDNNNIMSHAEDIISCGKLVPYKKQIPKSVSEQPTQNESRRSCDSLPDELNPARLSRSSRSLDCKRLRRNSSPVTKSDNIHRSSSAKGSERCKMGSKPRRWDWTMFGPAVKFPLEIDLRDMKNRQVRRNPATGGKSPRSSWGHDLLRVLSCKNHASVAVGFVPQV